MSIDIGKVCSYVISLHEENQKLKRENEQLKKENSELVQDKNDLYDSYLMSQDLVSSLMTDNCHLQREYDDTCDMNEKLFIGRCRANEEAKRATKENEHLKQVLEDIKSKCVM
jgi:regulator of replication initiation timing